MPFLSFLTSRWSKYVIGLVAVGLAAFAIYTYVSYTQNQIERLTRENSALELQVDQYRKAIAEIKAEHEKQRFLLDKFYDDMLAAGIPEDRAIRFFAENDLFSMDTVALEQLINDLAVDINRCFELLSGQPKLPKETNRLCQELTK
jgi:hypothetical protein